MSQPPAPSSNELSDLPVEVAEAVAQVVDFCREQTRSDPSTEAFETVETGMRDAMNNLGCKLLGAYAESRDDGASRIERAGQGWFRVAPTPKTIMTTLCRPCRSFNESSHLNQAGHFEPSCYTPSSLLQIASPISDPTNNSASNMTDLPPPELPDALISCIVEQSAVLSWAQEQVTALITLLVLAYLAQMT